MKILINCPGSWSHGLDSPERGEGRWAQNMARWLATHGGHAVYACSGGLPRWGSGDVCAGVTLLEEREAYRHEPFDLYIDASWWDGKPPAAKASRYVHLHFGYEDRLGVQFPPDHCIAYALRSSGKPYELHGQANAGRIFFLPAAFCADMAAPTPCRRSILHTVRGAADVYRLRDRFELVYAAVQRLRQQAPVQATWVRSPGYLEAPRHPDDRVLSSGDSWGIPYCALRQHTAAAGLNVSVDGWANVLDSAVLGVPSLAWDGSNAIEPGVLQVADAHGLALRGDVSAERVFDVMRLLFEDESLRVSYVRGLQGVFADHTVAACLDHFNRMVSAIFA